MIEDFKNKTRIVVCGDLHKGYIIKLLLHCVKFLNKKIDYITSSKSSITEQDFIIFEAENNKILNYFPNITLIANFDNFEDNYYSKYLETITAGGVVIYPENEENLQKIINSSQNYFRKITYKKPNFNIKNSIVYLDTDWGEIPLKIDENNIQNIEAAKFICQQIGIMEEDFYDSLMHYELYFN